MRSRRKANAYKPNVISKGDRLFNAVLGVALVAYGLVGLVDRRIDLVGARIRVAVFEGGPAVLMAAAVLVGAAVLFSTVVDHYDTRDNEHVYQQFRWCCKVLGICLVVAALLSQLYVGFVR